MQRSPLASISGNHIHKHELTPCERGIVVGVHSAGLTPSRIKRASGLGISTIKKTIQKASIRNHGQSFPRSGRPNLLNIRDERHLIRIAQNNPRITYKNLNEQTGLDCSTKTIYRTLKEYGLTNWLAKKRPSLSLDAAAKRMEWCLRHCEWGVEEWSKVIWADECSVEKGSGKERT